MENHIEITARNLDPEITESFVCGFSEHNITLRIHNYQDEWAHFEAPPDIILFISNVSWEVIFKPLAYDLLKYQFLQLWNNWVRSKKGTKNAIAFNAEMKDNTILNFSFSAKGSEEFVNKAFTEALNTIKIHIKNDNGLQDESVVNEGGKTITNEYDPEKQKWKSLDNQAQYIEEPSVENEDFG